LPKIIVDENIPRGVREWLLNRGFEVTSVAQTHLKGAKDLAIAEYAIKNNFTIFTLDNHFSQIYRMLKKEQRAIIIIKAKPATPSNIIEILEVAQQKIDLKTVRNKLVIISKRKIRIIT
jgi:predicted nuclease of predicted toxin-antitoxin system